MTGPLNDFRMARSYVIYPGFEQLYVRRTRRAFGSQLREPVLDIANVTARKKGEGTFTRFFHHIRKNYPQFTIYVEAVVNDRFALKLRKLGFVQLGNDLAPSFYMLPKEK